MPRFLRAVLNGAALTTVLFLSGAASASAACVAQPISYIYPSYNYSCDIYTEADLRQVNTLVQSYPFPDVIVRLRANVTVNRSIDFGNLNSLTVDTNGFTLIGDVGGTKPNRLMKLGAGSMSLTAPVSIRPTERREIQVRQGTLSIAADILQPQLTQESRLSLTDAGAVLQAGAPVRIEWALTLAKGAKPWYNPGDADARYDETIDTNGFSVQSTGGVYGSGRLVKTGAGTLALSGANYSLGGVLVTDGTLRASSDRSLGVLATDRLPFCQISFYDGPSCTTLPSMTAPLGLDGGTLAAGASFEIDRPIAIGTRGGTFDTDGFTLTLNGSLDGSGGLTKVGAGSLILRRPATYAGATVVNAGTLRVAAAGALPPDTELAIDAGATVDATGQRLIAGSLEGSGAVALDGGSAMIGSNNRSTVFAGALSGAGDFTKVGAGTLTFTTSQKYTGLTRVVSGRLSAVGLGGAVVVDPGATLSGSGMVAGPVSVDGTLIASSALTIGGNLLFGPTATYVVQAKPAANLVQVNGHTTINGARLELAGVTSTTPRVSVLPFLTSLGGVTGAFGAVDAPPSVDTLVAFHGATAFLVLERTDIPLASLAATANGAAAGRTLDAVRSTASGDLRVVVRELGVLPDADLGTALTQLGGSAAATALRLGTLDAEDVLRSINSRLVDLRTAARSEVNQARVGGLITEGLGVWFRATGSALSGDALASDLRLQGGLLGVDHAFANGRWLVGAFGGYDRAAVGLNAGANGLNDRRYRGGAYATTTLGHAYLDTTVAAGLHRFETTRHMAFAATLDPKFGGGALLGGIDRSASARYAGRDLGAFVESGVSGTMHTLLVQPFVGFDVNRTSSDGFKETGAGSIDLAASSAATTSLRGAIGMRAVRRFVAPGGRAFTPRVEIRYLRELLDRAASVPVAFADALTNGFSVASAPYGSHAIGPSGGFVLRASPRLLLTADYRGVFAPAYHTHAVTLGIAF